MAVFCSCATYPANTGFPSKQDVIAVAQKLVFVPLVADDGTRNHIDVTDTIDQAFIDGKLNNVDPSKRWYPVGNFQNVTDERADPTFETFNDNSRVITVQGLRTFQGMLVNFSSRYKAKLDTLFCQQVGVYSIDNCGNLAGSVSNDKTKLYPVAVANATVDPRLVKASGPASGKVMLTFDYSQLENDKNLWQINQSDVTADLLLMQGLRDVTAALSGPTTTEVVAALTYQFDGFSTAGASRVTNITGWVIADFALFNVTTGLAVTIDSLTEAPDGTYTLGFTAQTSGDTLRLRSAKNGFWFEQTIAIP